MGISNIMINLIKTQCYANSLIHGHSEKG